MSKIGISQKAIIHNQKGEILILHRTSETPSCPNYWDLPGGELDFGLQLPLKANVKRETLY